MKMDPAAKPRDDRIDHNMNDKLNLSPKSKQIQDMFDKISSRYDFLNRLLSFGQDVRWRKCLIKKIPVERTNSGILYDVAC